MGSFLSILSLLCLSILDLESDTGQTDEQTYRQTRALKSHQCIMPPMGAKHKNECQITQSQSKRPNNEHQTTYSKQPSTGERTDKAWFTRLCDIQPGNWAGLYVQYRNHGVLTVRGLAAQLLALSQALVSSRVTPLHCLVWLVNWFIDWLIDRLIDWLTGWLPAIPAWCTVVADRCKKSVTMRRRLLLLLVLVATFSFGSVITVIQLMAQEKPSTVPAVSLPDPTQRLPGYLVLLLCGPPP